MFAFPKEQGRPYVFAHRGAMTEAPENTIPSFLAAERLGCDGVELDVHLSSDGVAVVTHGRPGPGAQAHGRTQTGGAGTLPRRRPSSYGRRAASYRRVTVIGVCTTGVARTMGEDSLAVSVWVPGCRAVAV